MPQADTIWWSLLARGYRRMDGGRIAIEVETPQADQEQIFRVRFHYPGEKIRELRGSYRTIQAGIARLPVRRAT